VTRPRPGYIERRRMLEAERKAHRKDPPPGCLCPECVGLEVIHATFAARQAAERARAGEPPF
jgi:hypothetical protein